MVFIAFILIVFIFLLVITLYIILNGTPVAKPDISRKTQVFGEGPVLTYVVMGDSTSIGQGTSYEKSIAQLSAKYLAKTHEVAFTNIGISGATAATVLRDQAAVAAHLHPDIVLLVVGANDITHLTVLSNLERSMRLIVATLRATAPDVRIILTGSPDMGSIPRFPWPVRQISGWRTKQVNRTIQDVADELHCERLLIAEKTGQEFRKNPRLFAVDKFHPIAEGYALWMPIIFEALDKATSSESSL
jgi:lysophospholipase L1-like esterase